MKQGTCLIIAFLLFLNVGFSQSGKLLVIGGGSEESGSEAWNAEAYQWAVDQSENKKVAVISYSSDSQWLPDHFVSDWGAKQSKLFLINSSAEATSQATYDTLMQYDVIFLKGGNQADYYTTYNNTKTEQAITDKFNNGGVICGTSAGLAVLGGVDFTAENGTVYPYECMANWDNQYVKLKDDFLPLLDGFIFDSHFVQRGRFPRLLGFLANWQTNYSETITGIGVDDKTALAINADKNATAYGSGCASIYHTKENSILNQDQNHLVIDSISVTQLIDNTSMDLTNFEVSGFNNLLEPDPMQETGNYTIFASGGSNKVSDNLSLLEDFALEVGSMKDTVLILSGNNQDTAKLFEDQLNSLGVNNTEVYPATSVYSDNVALEEALKSADKYLFVKAGWNELKKFVGSNNGELLLERLCENESVSAFIGDNSRFAGKSVVINYDGPYASYDGTYQLDEGLGLLKTTVLIPRTFASEFDANYSQYENTAAAVPYAMVKDTLAYGIWLTRNNYVKFQPNEGYNYLHAHGEWPVMILKNKGTTGEVVSRGVSGPDTEVRMLGGFQNMEMSVIDSTVSYKMGNTEEEEVVGITPEIQYSNVQIYTGHSANQIRIDWKSNTFDCYLFNIRGQKIMMKSDLNGSSVLNYPEVSPGIYILRLENETGNIVSKRVFLQ